MTTPDELSDRAIGTILGTAVGDAIGLPFENLSAHRVGRLLGKRALSHRFLFGHGMVSDDTEHTCLLAEALLLSPNDPEQFSRYLARRLRYWLLGLPAGIGRATLLGSVRLWLGIDPACSGVHSAGNGPAMRSALLGVCLGEDLETLRRYVRAATRLTHTDARAERGALVVALAAHHGATRGPQAVNAGELIRQIRETAQDADGEMQQWLTALESALSRNDSLASFAETLGIRQAVTGYVYHTVPIALYAWLTNPSDYRMAVDSVVRLGGDTDTVGAICGALAGATLGAARLPQDWLDGICDVPYGTGYMRRLGAALAKRLTGPDEGACRPPKRLWLLTLPRNLVFLAIVLLHLMHRLLPPW